MSRFSLNPGRVTPSTSLFTYPVGKNYSDYNDPTFTPDFIDLSALVAQNPNAADICGENQACLYDFFTTGDESFARETINLVIEQEQAQNDSQLGN